MEALSDIGFKVENNGEEEETMRKSAAVID